MDRNSLADVRLTDQMIKIKNQKLESIHAGTGHRNIADDHGTFFKTFLATPAKSSKTTPW